MGNAAVKLRVELLRRVLRSDAEPPYLHDGAAATLEQAILRHAGEASASRNLYIRIDREDRGRLLRFVATR
jgi:CxxC motif-containing protein (DUF1111 family)